MTVTDAAGRPLLVRNGRLLDVVTGTYAEGDLLAVDGRIAETGPGVTAPADAEVRDLRGGFVLPGLIDAHVHVTAITADLGSLGPSCPFHAKVAKSTGAEIGMPWQGISGHDRRDGPR
jgi:imidazolonepropionase-like amidohydrolase